MSRWGPLLLILLGTAILGGLFLGTVFPGYGPDELSHFGYVRFIAEGHGFPVLGRDTDPSGPSYESHQPPLYYALAAPFYLAGKSMRGETGEWLGVRLWTLLCGLGTVALVYLLILRLFPDEPALASAAGAFTGWLPSQLMLFSVVNNDALTELGFTLTLYLLALYRLGDRQGKRLPVWIGVAAGLTLLTKASALVLIPVGLCVLLWPLSTEEKQSRFRPALLFLAGMVICVPWLIRNQATYGDPIAWGAFKNYFLNVQHSPTPQSLSVLIGVPYSPVWYWKDAVLDWAFRDSLGMWLFTQIGKTIPIKVSLPPSFYPLWGLSWVAALIGCVRFGVTEGKQKTLAWKTVAAALFGTLGLLLVAYLRLNVVFYWAHSRYLFPAVSALAMIWAVGWSRLVPARYRDMLLAGVNIGLFFVGLFAGYVLLGGFFERLAMRRL